MKPRVAITGLGAVSSLGVGVSPFFEGLLAGVQAVRGHAELAAAGLGTLPVGIVSLLEFADLPNFAPSNVLAGTARAQRLAELAAKEALADGGWPQSGQSAAQRNAPRLGLCIGTTLGEKNAWLQALRRQALPPAGDGATAILSEPTSGHSPVDFGCAAPARWLAKQHDICRMQVISVACASSNAAIGVALNWIRADLCDAVLCGGVDALQDFVITGFLALRAHALLPCRPFDAERCGMNLGEGAAFVLLESECHAQARGQHIRAYLDGSGRSGDGRHMTGPDREGKGAARAMQAALADAGLDAADVDFVSAHGTATRFNDLMEAQALHAVFAARSASVPVNSIKGAIGHSLGAAGALEAVMAVRILEEQRIPPTAGHSQCDPNIALNIVSGAARAAKVRHVLSTSSGFGGLNAALLFSSAATDAACIGTG